MGFEWLLLGFGNVRRGVLGSSPYTRPSRLLAGGCGSEAFDKALGRSIAGPRAFLFLQLLSRPGYR